MKSDPHEARTAATVHTLTLGFVGAAAVWAVAAAFVMPRPMLSLAVAATIVGFLLAAFVIAHVGNPQLAACVLVSGVWLGTTCAVAFVSGVAAVSISTYIIAILAAGLLIGANAAIVVAALSATASLGLAYLQTQGRLPEVVAPSPWGSVAIELTLFVAAAALLTDALGRLQSALERAEQSEAQTRALIEQASDAIVVTDPDGWIVDANARAASLLGYDVEELLGLSPRDFLDGEELADSDQVRIGLQPGQRALVERTARRRDGSLVEVEGAVSRLEDGRIQVSMRDVGERRQAERMQERLRMALDAAGEAILLLDEEMGLLYANSAFRRMYGGTGPLEPGMHLEQITDLPHRRELLERALPDVSEGRPWAGRHERVLDDGTRAVRHATMAPVRDGAGGLVGYVAILRDITREVELEESLQLSQKLEAVGQLAGGLAHDFNNLLTVILGTAELLRDTAPSEDVDEIFEAGQRAAALTTKLLAFSRNQAVVRRRVDLNEVVREVSGMLRRLVRENVAFEMRLSAEPVWIDADPSQIHQVLVNLVANARDAMTSGGELVVSTSALDLSRRKRPAGVRLPDGPYAVLSVRDDGEGMSEEVQAHLFEPFFTTKEPGRGTGMGLASVHGIVQQSGGAIDVESQLGKGTLIRVLLPRAEAPSARDEEARIAYERPQTEGVKVLVVEDETLIRTLVRRALQARGHRVVTARSGTEALDLALAEPPDLLVTDVVLPGLDGRRLVARLRETRPDLPVLFSTGYSPEEVGPDLEEDEQTVFLAKPFTVAQLAQRIELLLSRREV